jgi:hypothetical protein
VRLVKPDTEADPVAILVQLLVAFGNCIGRGAYFLAEADRHHTNLFAALVGETSKARKGVALGHVLHLFRGLGAGAGAFPDVRAGLSSGEGVIWAVRDPDIQDKRLFIVESELASVLRVMGRDGNTLSPLIRQAWDTGDLETLTKNSPAKATGAHVSIVGHITAEELRCRLDRTEMGNGFANRFLWVFVRRSQLLPEGGQLDQEALKPVAKAIGAAVRFARGLRQRRIDRSRRARGLWHEVYPSLSEGTPGLLGAVISRAEAQVMRLALVYALLDQQTLICDDHLQAALALWTYCEASARFLFGNRLGDPVADALCRMLRQRLPQGMSRTEVSNAFGRNLTSAEMERALSILEQLGLAKRLPGGPKGRGRPEERWLAIIPKPTKETRKTK